MTDMKLVSSEYKVPEEIPCEGEMLKAGEEKEPDMTTTGNLTTRWSDSDVFT